MKRSQAISLNGALMNAGLKVKHMSGETYVNYLNLKRSLDKYLREMGEMETEVAKEHGVKIGDRDFVSDDTGFWDKLREVQAVEFNPAKLNFIPMSEFKPWVDDIPMSHSDILAEHLLAP